MGKTMCWDICVEQVESCRDNWVEDFQDSWGSEKQKVEIKEQLKLISGKKQTISARGQTSPAAKSDSFFTIECGKK